MTTRVVLADDHPLFRDGLRALLESMGVEVVGEAGTGAEAVAVVNAHAPDVVAMDLHMPEVNGIEATAALSAGGSSTRVLVLSMLDDDDSVFAALRAGATGYVLKDAGQTEIVGAIQAVARGEAVFGSSIARRVLDHLLRTGVSPRPFPHLTQREHEVLEHMARGASNQEIARKLFLAEKTVRNNVSGVLSKLHVSARAEAIAKARDAGLGAPDGWSR